MRFSGGCVGAWTVTAPLACRAFFAAVLFLGLTCRCVVAAGEFEGWNLEPGVAQAHLVMVARVASVSQLTIVEGAKTDVALREYRFQPIRRLKGIFQRDQLSMTAADLGCRKDDAALAPPLKEGEYRLLILVQQQGFGSMGCVSAAPGVTTFDERVPRLSGPDDPLIGVVETLIQVADARSRQERAKLLTDRLATTEGLPAVTLLSSLLARADWAAADARNYTSLASLIRSPLPAVRRGAVETLRALLAERVAPASADQLDGVAEALRELLSSDEAVTQVRLMALEACGHLSALRPDLVWPRELLIAQLNGAATYDERSTAATALSRSPHADSVQAVLKAFGELPLDESTERETIYAKAAVRLDSAAAEQALQSRLGRSLAARQSLAAEIQPLGEMRSKASVAQLLSAAAEQHLEAGDRHLIAWSLGRMADDRAVPVLVDWCRSDDYQLKEHALSALENLDTPTAAREARPLLKPESHLPYKLRLARLLARDEINDGYALATEHLADAGRTAEAALVLAALDDPRTSAELKSILAARPDRRWHAAALTGLAVTGDQTSRAELLTILNDDRHPLAADAAECAGLISDGDLLQPLARLSQSRNHELAKVALVALRRYVTGVRSSPLGLAAAYGTTNIADGIDIPADARAAMYDAMATLALDAYVDPGVRREAFDVARLLRGDQYGQLLEEMANQTELEGTALLEEVRAARREVRDAVR